jgi:hypothetical protein
MVDNKQTQAGFALLISLIVVSVVVSIGLVLLDVTIKQLRLSSNSTDSELAFHAANAGMECARYIRREAGDAIEGDEFASPLVEPGGSINGIGSCFGANVVATVATVDVEEPADDDGSAFLYQYEFDWGTDRCSEVDMVVAVADIFGAAANPGDGVTVLSADMRAAIPGYPHNQDLVCSTGSYCTVISVKGYNRSCANKAGFGTVQREVLLEL